MGPLGRCNEGLRAHSFGLVPGTCTTRALSPLYPTAYYHSHRICYIYFSSSTVASTIPASQNCTVSYSHSMTRYRCLPPCYFVVTATDALLVSPAVPFPCSFISYVMSPAWRLSNSRSYRILLGPSPNNFFYSITFLAVSFFCV